jgi:DNA-binding FrmR family transcriptional regulator
MFGLLLEYVADEHSEAGEAARRAFLRRLKTQLEAVQGTVDISSSAEVMGALRAIHRAVPDELQNDPVVEHLSACVEELERVRANQARRQGSSVRTELP